jgi:hypothetical protein
VEWRGCPKSGIAREREKKEHQLVSEAVCNPIEPTTTTTAGGGGGDGGVLSSP